MVKKDIAIFGFLRYNIYIPNMAALFLKGVFIYDEAVKLQRWNLCAFISGR